MGEREHSESSFAVAQRFAPEPRGSLAFQPRIRARRTFDGVEMAEGEGLYSNVLCSFGTSMFRPCMI
jgi:hypothetical protein